MVARGGAPEEGPFESALLADIATSKCDDELALVCFEHLLALEHQADEQEFQEEMLEYREEQAFGAEAEAPTSTHQLHEPELSDSPIGQKPNDVEALPITYKDVVRSKYKKWWDKAIDKELSGHTKTGTFSMRDVVPEGRKPVSSKWVFFWKLKELGLITDF